MPGHIVYGDQWPSEAVTVPDALEPCCFGGKPCGRTEVSECARQVWELVNVVDSLPCHMVGIEILDVSEE